MIIIHPAFLNLGGGALSGWAEVEEFLDVVAGELAALGG